MGFTTCLTGFKSCYNIITQWDLLPWETYVNIAKASEVDDKQK